MFTDDDFAGDLVTRKLQSGIFIFLEHHWSENIDELKNIPEI